MGDLQRRREGGWGPLLGVGEGDSGPPCPLHPVHTHTPILCPLFSTPPHRPLPSPAHPLPLPLSLAPDTHKRGSSVHREEALAPGFPENSLPSRAGKTQHDPIPAWSDPPALGWKLLP